MGRIPQLDGIRGVAILLVVIFHYSAGSWGGAAPLQVSPHSVQAALIHLAWFGWTGVDLFFVLSGFLIGSILIDSRRSKRYFVSFYIRRSFRILPLYFLFIAIALPFYPIDANPLRDGYLAPFGFYFILSANLWMSTVESHIWLGHTWSLGVEEQFYLFLPPLIWLTPPRALRVVLISFILSAFAFRYVLALKDTTSLVFLHFSFPARVDTLLTGVLCADLYRDARIKTWLREHRPVLYVAFISLLVAVLVMVKMNWTIGTAPTAIFGYNVLAVFYATALLIALTEDSGPIFKITTNRLLQRLGILAYFIFLIHIIVPNFVFRLLGMQFDPSSPRHWLLLSLCGFATVLLAAISWRYFEQPLIRIGRRLTREQTHHDRSVNAHGLAQ